MDIFPSEFPQPDKGVELIQTENIVKINFGDGYEQRVTQGINSKKQILNLKWKQPASVSKNIHKWLNERKNKSPFKFTYFNDVERQYICTEAKLTDNSPSPCLVSATFEENFDIE